MQDDVEIEERLIGSTIPGKRIRGYVSSFSFNTKDGGGSGTKFFVRVTSTDSYLFETDYKLSKFPVRINDYGQIIAIVPKVAMLDQGLTEIHITRFSRPMRQRP